MLLEGIMDSVAAVIMAAGKGTRMKSEKPKVLHTLAGRPMIQYVIDVARAVEADPIVVVLGHMAEEVKDFVQDEGIVTVLQEPQLGTGHAVNCTRGVLGDFRGSILVLSGDVPLLEAGTLRALVKRHLSSRAILTLLVGRMEDPRGFGRILRDDKGRIVAIVEEGDATEEQRGIKEVNAGAYCFSSAPLFRALDGLKNDNVKGEFYLTDVVKVLALEGIVESYEASCADEFMGINDRGDLARAQEVVRGRICRSLMESGVSLLDPRSTYIDWGVKVGRDSFIHPNVVIEGKSIIGDACTIEAGSVIQSSVLGKGVVVRPYSVISQSIIEDRAIIGPFAHIRPESHIGPQVKVGNFVEVKKSSIAKGTKASHLSYIGDAIVGEGVNIGAGTITCNYDGIRKHTTIIEDGAFIGSDTQLVAPVRVGKGAVVGAGSVITKDVPPGSLAIGRARQEIKRKVPKKRKD